MAIPSTAQDAVKAQIEGLRGKLLDLTMRNRMLNFKPSKRLGLTFTGENGPILFRLLVDQEKRLSFRGNPENLGKSKRQNLFEEDNEITLAKFRAEAEEELDSFLDMPGVPPQTSDTKLCVNEPDSVVQTKLRIMQREAKSAAEELGVDTLFLTIGVLQWSEIQDKTFQAPLLFVPVSIETLANGSMRLAHEGSDPGLNLPLQAKLMELDLRLPSWDDDKPVEEYFAAVESAVSGRPAWFLDAHQVHLGFFSYEKYSMYVDLGGENWQPESGPSANPQIQAILGGGFSGTESFVHESTFLDDVRPAADSTEVFDADSSQVLVMVRAAEGLSMVVEGPPGTGKSQTITNIIADSVVHGKTVLFVSAKRAALEVVKRKLEEADLGAVCLDLHDKGANRREFYASIKRTASTAVHVRDESEKVMRLEIRRSRLNGYSAAVNEQITGYQLTPFEAMARLARLPKETTEDREGRIPFEDLRAMTVSELDRALPTVRALQLNLNRIGAPMSHPFWGAEIDYIDPALRLDLKEDIAAAKTAVASALDAWNRAAGLLRVELKPTTENIHVLARCAEIAASAPPVNGVALKSSEWSSHRSEVLNAVSLLRTRSLALGKLKGRVLDSAFTTDLNEVAQAFASSAKKWYGFTSADFRRARKKIAALMQGEGPKGVAGEEEVLEQLLSVQSSERQLSELAGEMRGLFGTQWKGLDSDAAVLEKLLEWVLDLQSQVQTGTVPRGLLDFLTGEFDCAQTLTKVSEASAAARDALSAYDAAARDLRHDSQSAGSEEFSSLLERLGKWEAGLGRLADYIAFAEARKKVAACLPNSVVDVANRWPLASERLFHSVERSYFSGVVREAMGQRPDLREFERENHEQTISDFKSLDDFKLHYNRAKVRLAHQQRLPALGDATGNLRQLRLQCELTRGHRPSGGSWKGREKRFRGSNPSL